MKHADTLPPYWRPIARFRWWWRRRPVTVSVWEMAHADRWESHRHTLLKERGLTEADVSDSRVP